MECVICGGSKEIRLPVRRPVSAVYEDDLSPRLIDDSVRTYPCPECTEVQDHKLHIACAAAWVYDCDLDRYTEALEITQRTAAHNLAEYMLRHGLIQFREQPDPTGAPGKTETIAKLAVVDPSRITPLEQRVKEATGPAISEVVGVAIAKIDVWGRDLGRKSLLKEEAARFVLEAAREVTSKIS